MNNSNKITDRNARMINGPVNVIRLEGQVYGIKKVLYLFLDFHVDVQNQTQCTNIYSEDIQKYFVNSFDKLNQGSKIYDFFMEIHPSELINGHTNFDSTDYRDKYIREVVKFFQKLFKFDPQKNKVEVNELFKNVRLHYLDIRDYFQNYIYFTAKESVNIARQFMINDYIDPRGINEIVQIFKLIENHINQIIDILSKQQPKSNTPPVIKFRSMDLDIKTIEYLTNKLQNSYNHVDIRNKMLGLLKDSIDDFQKFVETIKSTIMKLEKYSQVIISNHNKLTKESMTNFYGYGLSQIIIREMITDIVNTCDTFIYGRLLDIFAKFTDIYFLRRFLDKDYITNAIVYTGALHSNNYVHFLINEFDFRITHASYSKIDDMQELTNEIKKTTFDLTQELIYPEQFGQCSSMKGFPEEFN